MSKAVAYGISWIPLKLIQSFLTTDWNFLDYTRRQLTYEEVNEKKPEVIISYRSPPAELIKHGNVKWMISPGAGVDKLPLRNLSDDGVTVIRSHGNSNTVAEQAWALLLTAAKKITKYENIIRQQEMWPDRSSQIKDLNFDLENKTIGIIGHGPIGIKIENYAIAFSMETLIFRRTPKASNQYKVSDLNNMADELDFLIIAYPLTKETEGIVSQEVIDSLPSHCIVANIARGELVNEDAMFDALREGKIQAYSSDVWVNSPMSRSDIGIPPEQLVDIPNLTISPHRAWLSKDSFAKMARQIASELDNIAKGIESSNVVDLSLEYT